MSGAPGRQSDATGWQARLDQLKWYHTIDVAPGVVTRGWFELRHALPLLPFPEIKGARCLDVGTWDGFYAFELERRGAREVVAIDVPDLAQIDYPPEVRADPQFDPSQSQEQPRTAGFHLLHELLQSSVEWRGINIYDLAPSLVGEFDVVVIGSLLLHLRDPVRALDAVRRVTSGHLLVIDYLHPPVHLLARRRPLFELRGESRDFQWWLASDRGLRRLLHVGGFQVEQTSRLFLLRPGLPGRSSRRSDAGGRRSVMRALNWLLTGDSTPGGHLHRAYLARPRF